MCSIIIIGIHAIVEAKQKLILVELILLYWPLLIKVTALSYYFTTGIIRKDGLMSSFYIWVTLTGTNQWRMDYTI